MVYSLVLEKLACHIGGKFWTAIRSTLVSDSESCEVLVSHLVHIQL